VLEGGIYECLWLGDNDVIFSMVKRAYQNFNTYNSLDYDIYTIQKLVMVTTLTQTLGELGVEYLTTSL